MTARPAIARLASIAALALATACAAGCSGSVVMTRSGDGGGESSAGALSPSQVASACQNTCQAIENAGCALQGSLEQCVTSCSQIPTTLPACAGQAEDYVRCAEGTTPTCGDGGTEFPGCDSLSQALTDCVNQNIPSTGGFGCTLTTNQCPDIPPPKGTAACSAGGSAGGGGPSVDTYSCQDAQGNMWAATCSGGTCTCTYNGASACTCTQSADMGTCGSCCPGAG